MNHSALEILKNQWPQLAFFYGLLVVLGGLEVWIPQSKLPPNRRRRWGTNFGLPLLSNWLLGLLPLSGLVASTWASQRGFGLLNQIKCPAFAALALTMAARSLASWLLHILMHKTPFLWRIHRIHHLDTVMDISTTGRFHPFEFFLSFVVLVATIALLGLPVWALVVYEPLETVVRFFSHANIRLPEGLDRTFRLFFSTPGFHRIHHSLNRSEADSNYGVIFSFWDRLFGTFSSPEGKDLAEMDLGVAGNEEARVQSLGWLLKNPFLSN